MPIPSTPAYFEPQDARRFYADKGGLFLVDPQRVQEWMGDSVVGSDLIHTLTRKPEPHGLYRDGAIVPALGVDQIPYTVDVRSSATRAAPMLLSHMLFSTGFVLGTETGDLLLCNTGRLQHWTPGRLPEAKAEYPLSSMEQPLHISPGWYGVTVVTGLRDLRENPDEEWVCCFLLTPQPTQPAFIADLTLPLAP